MISIGLHIMRWRSHLHRLASPARLGNACRGTTSARPMPCWRSRLSGSGRAARFRLTRCRPLSTPAIQPSTVAMAVDARSGTTADSSAARRALSCKASPSAEVVITEQQPAKRRTRKRRQSTSKSPPNLVDNAGALNAARCAWPG